MRRGIFLIATMMLALGVALSACNGGGGDKKSSDGGGDPMTLEDYFDELLGIRTSSQAQSEQIDSDTNTQIEAAGEDVDGAVSALTSGVQQYHDLALSVVDDLDALSPPDEAAVANDAMASAFQDGADAMETLLDDLGGVSTVEDLDALGTDIQEKFTTLTNATTSACDDLQAVADENNIDVNLDCAA